MVWSENTGLSHSRYSLNFENGYLPLGCPVGLDETADLSVSAWILTDTLSGYRGIVIRRENLPLAPYDWELYGGSYGSGFSVSHYTGGAEWLTGPPMTTGQWYHMGFTLSGGTARLYLNGTEIGSLPGMAYATTANVYVGVLDDRLTNDPGRHWVGLIDDVAIYSGTLTQPEIAALAAGKNPLPEPATLSLLALGGLAVLRRRR